MEAGSTNPYYNKYVSGRQSRIGANIEDYTAQLDQRVKQCVAGGVEVGVCAKIHADYLRAGAKKNEAEDKLNANKSELRQCSNRIRGEALENILCEHRW